MTRRYLSLALLVSLSSVGCQQEPIKHTKHVAANTPAAPTGVVVDSAKLSLFAALPEKAPSSNNLPSDEKVALGRVLYHDARLSKGHDVSCNSCHDLSKFGVDGNDFSLGSGKKKQTRNTPT